MPKMTKKGAASVTGALDRIATLFQNEYETLGVPERIANDFAYRCDLLSDRVERVAGLSRRALSELDVAKEPGFDPEVIGEETTGPLEGDADESFMKAEFTQQENRELRERVEDGDLGIKPNLEEQAPQSGKQASLNIRLARATADLLGLANTASVAKLAAAALKVQAGYLAGDVTAAHAQRTLTALGHVLPVLATVKNADKVASVIRLAHRIIAKKSEDEGEGDKPEKGKIPPQFLENVNKKKEEAKDKEDEGKGKEDEGEDKEDEGEGKKASHGFDLFA